MYLFDTDVITNVYKKRPSPSLLERLAGTHPDDQYISVITVGEIVFGAEKSKRPVHHLKQLQALLSEVSVLDFDLRSAYLAGKIRANLETAGTPLAWADIQIAAIAQANQLTLVTGNTRHFEKISGLAVGNWL